MYFHGFFATEADEPAGGLRLHSALNRISMTLRVTLLNPIVNLTQRASSESFGRSAPAPFTNDFEGLATVAFSVDLLYVSCTGAIALGNVALPLGCTVRFEAYDGSGNLKGTKIPKSSRGRPSFWMTA